jgi:predicted RNase H-like HicB family nuclease
MKYRVLIQQDEDAGIREAIALYVESLEARGEPVPPPITEEIVEI